jgi:HD domain
VELPPPVSEYLQKLIHDTRYPAFLLTDAAGRLVSWGGNLEKYGIDHPIEGEDVSNQVLFLDGMFPFNGAHVFLSCVKTESGTVSDVHLFSSDGDIWILMLDATEQEIRQRTMQQKGNELVLLRKRLARLIDRTENLPKPADRRDDATALNDIVAAMEIVPLERMPNGNFRLIGTVPDWFKTFYPDAINTRVLTALSDTFPFIENFLIDADDIWHNKQSVRIKSGPWVETGLTGKEMALEASAYCAGETNILLIELLGPAYEERTVLLQKARENSLLNEYLEEEVRKRTAEIRRREEEIIIRLVWAAESRDNDTGDHIRRLGLYSEALAKAMGWPAEESDDIRLAASMHDIGKIGIPDSILNKPGKLTDKELEIMQKHTELGAKILVGSGIPLLQMAQEIAQYHHEKWDGSGYPGGVAGKEIPASARIVTIADVYDALIHSRVYKTAKTEESTVSIMSEERGKKFDPDIFEIFLRLLPEFRRIRQEFPGASSNEF